MMPLEPDYNFTDGDAVYAALVASHRGLSVEASAALNARLVLLLANHIGDAEVLAAAIVKAATAGGKSHQSPTT